MCPTSVSAVCRAWREAWDAVEELQVTQPYPSAAYVLQRHAYRQMSASRRWAANTDYDVPSSDTLLSDIVCVEEMVYNAIHHELGDEGSFGGPVGLAFDEMMAVAVERSFGANISTGDMFDSARSLHADGSSITPPSSPPDPLANDGHGVNNNDDGADIMALTPYLTKHG